MEELKFVVDVLSSIASFIAISTVLIAWYVGRLNPLSVKKVLIHVKEDEKVYNLYIKNRRSYPVTIESIRCFTSKKYRIEKTNNGSAELLTAFPLDGCIFENLGKAVIEPNGYTKVTNTSSSYNDNAKNYMFCIESSHGYFETHCKNIQKVTFGTIVLGIESAKEFKSKKHAYMYFLSLKIKHWCRWNKS
ncbi:hypothetical protein HBG08_004696 [Vibrio parahaemolyticus]|nr:hypothetical protein [Vibrio parahaemolyticus]EGR0841485.1 hypothetical protein [Vibrio parahaemolyticus]